MTTRKKKTATPTTAATKRTRKRATAPATKAKRAPGRPRGESLIQLIMARGISRAGLAERMGVSHGAIKVACAQGLTSPDDPRSLVNVRTIAHALGMAVGEVETALADMIELGKGRFERMAERSRIAAQRASEASATRTNATAKDSEARAARGEKLHAAIKASEMTQREAADKLGMSASGLRRLMHAGFRLDGEYGTGISALEIEQALGFERSTFT